MTAAGSTDPRAIRVARRGAALVALLLLLAAQAATAAPFSLLNRAVPPFTVNDTGGRVVSSDTLNGRWTLLFTFCACDACAQIGRTWAARQHAQSGESAMSTFVIYGGSAQAARAFATAMGFDAATTTVTCDPSMRAAAAMRGLPCPSVFVVDPSGVIRYASKEMAPHSNAPSLLLGQAANVLRVYRGEAVSMAAAEPPPEPPMAATGPSLTPLTDPSTQATEEHGLEWRADIKQSTVTHTFTFRNDNKVAVEIRRVQPSCGCSAVTLMQRGQPVANPVVGPGETLEVCVTADIGETTTEKMVSVWLFSDAAAPVAWARMALSRSHPPRL